MPEGVDVKQPTPENFKPFPVYWFETTFATFEGYLADALAQGVYKVAPPPVIVNRNGLEGIQEGVDLMRVATEKGQEEIMKALNRTEGSTREDKTSPVKLVVERP